MQCCPGKRNQLCKQEVSATSQIQKYFFFRGSREVCFTGIHTIHTILSKWEISDHTNLTLFGHLVSRHFRYVDHISLPLLQPKRIIY